MKKALVISPVFPSPTNNGSLVRIFNITKELSKYYEITFASPIGPDTKQIDVDRVSDVCSRLVIIPTKAVGRLKKIQSILSHLPYHVSLYYEPHLKKAILNLLDRENFSFIYCNFIYSLQYLKKNMPAKTIFLDQHNVDREYWTRKVLVAESSIERIISKINLYKTIKFENAWLQSVKGYISVSEIDKLKTYNYAFPEVSHFFVAPNGVDIEAFPLRSYEDKGGQNLVLGFLGSLDLRINQNAVKYLITKIFPVIKDRLKDFRISLLIIGRNPPDELRYLGQSPDITFTGTVDSVYPFLSKVDILICPLEGGAGTKLRLFEAMATGVPVIGSKYVFEGVEKVVWDQIAFTSDDVDGYCDYISRLALDSKLRKDMGIRARGFVEREFSWSQIVAQLTYDINRVIVDQCN